MKQNSKKDWRVTTSLVVALICLFLICVMAIFDKINPDVISGLNLRWLFASWCGFNALFGLFTGYIGPIAGGGSSTGSAFRSEDPAGFWIIFSFTLFWRFLLRFQKFGNLLWMLL